MDLPKARRRKLTITANEERIEAAARRMKAALLRWITAASERFAADEIRKLRARKRKLAKAESQSELDKELLRILVTYGIKNVDDAGKDMAARAGGDWEVTPDMVERITRQKLVAVQQLTGETRRRVRSQVRKVLLDASKESPRPSIAEIARRIRTQVVELPPLRGAKNPELLARANRAELIARTEVAQAQNTGIHEGMVQAGVDEIEWLAFSDGKSGNRHHERMNGKRITIEDSQSNDPDRWFLTPLGNRLRYPGDPNGPIADIARCRCTILPVIKRGDKTISPGRAEPKVRSGQSPDVLNRSRQEA